MVQSISKRSLLFLTLFSFTFATPPEDDGSILGKWELDQDVIKSSLSEEGLKGEELELATAAVEAVSMVYEFNEDGTFIITMSTPDETKSLTGEWKLDGTSLSTLLKDSEEWDVAEISWKEGQLVIANEEESLVFKRVE
ncbi:MAG: hypothetical protein ACE5EE_09890 [Fidelibacterota bacterium]